ncbi:MAG: aldehyde dehydrogenase family protein [Phycisphaerales bacterium]
MTPIDEATRASDLIAGHWRELAGDAIRSHEPAHPDRAVWSGTPVPDHAQEAVQAAREALPAWRAMGLEGRTAALRAYQNIARERADEVARLISRETGKALWDCQAEAGLLSGKVDITIEPPEAGPHAALARVMGFEINAGATRIGRTRFRSHGVMGVLGPFNFPAHLPNGHIVPALLLGNTIVFKPSDKAPAVGQMLAAMFHEALLSVRAPTGAINLVHGGADIARSIVDHSGVDGILFTGSWPVGRKILEANLDRPGRIVALELGGNNPAIVMDDADLRQAAIECCRAAFVTTGQRCTCTRRLIVHKDIADRFIPLLLKAAGALVIGDPLEGVAGQPAFMGPIIRAEARDAVLRFQHEASTRGNGRILMEATSMDHPSGGHYITPGVLEVPRFSLSEDRRHDAGCDEEVFGPLLRISIARDFDDALEQANATRYGLAASLFSSDAGLIDRFLDEAAAGCVNINTGTAGASGKLPFGGLGLSGNHRPAGSFSVDYCAYPVASLIESGDAAGLLPGMRFDDDWL